MKLLVETTQEVELLKEAKEDGSKNYYIKGVFLQGDITNRNGRVYPSQVLAKEVAEYKKNYIDKSRAYGELNHPESPSINLNLVSHLITELCQDGSNFVGKAKVMNTPNGKIVKALMDEGCMLGVSSRGLGSLKEQNGRKIVQNDFRLSTAGDIVADPSAHQAFVENLMEEAEWVMERGQWVPKYKEKSKKKLDEMVRKRATKAEREQVFLSLFEGFIQRIK